MTYYGMCYCHCCTEWVPNLFTCGTVATAAAVWMSPLVTMESNCCGNIFLMLPQPLPHCVNRPLEWKSIHTLGIGSIFFATTNGLHRIQWTCSYCVAVAMAVATAMQVMGSDSIPVAVAMAVAMAMQVMGSDSILVAVAMAVAMAMPVMGSDSILVAVAMAVATAMQVMGSDSILAAVAMAVATALLVMGSDPILVAVAMAAAMAMQAMGSADPILVAVAAANQYSFNCYLLLPQPHSMNTLVPLQQKSCCRSCCCTMWTDLESQNKTNKNAFQ